MSLFEEVNQIENARGFCSAASLGIDRFGNDCLFNHSNRIYESVKTLWPDDSLAQVAAWLHDLVEDTPVTLEVVERNFGKAVANTVDLLTAREGEHYDDYLIRLIDGGDISALRVKYCDGLDNSDICVGLIDAENLSVDSFLYYRAKYRIATTIISGVIRKMSPKDDPVVELHKTIAGIWEREYDRPAIRRLRNGVHIPLYPKGRILSTIKLYDENPHWKNEFSVTPWGLDVERHHLGDKLFEKRSSSYHFANMMRKVRDHVPMSIAV